MLKKKLLQSFDPFFCTLCSVFFFSAIPVRKFVGRRKCYQKKAYNGLFLNGSYIFKIPAGIFYQISALNRSFLFSITALCKGNDIVGGSGGSYKLIEMTQSIKNSNVIEKYILLLYILLAVMTCRLFIKE